MFYRLNIISKKLGNDPLWFSTLLLMTMTTFFQFFFIVLGIGVLLHMDVWSFFVTDPPIFPMVIFALVFLGVNSLVFTYKGKWKRFIKEFENESEKQRILGKYCLFISFPLCMVASGYFIVMMSPHYSY